MKTLQEFLNKNTIEDIKAEVIISDRFKDEQGNLLPFTIKAMTNEAYENARIKAIKKSKNSTEEFNSTAFNYNIVINNTIEPNFKDATSIDSLNAGTPENYLKKVLLPGEIINLAGKILELSGFNKSFDELVEEAKN